MHVEDIKERQYDYVSSNLGGEDALQQFQSDDDDEDGHSDDDLQEFEHLETESLGGSTTNSKRDSSSLRTAHRRSQSSVHLSPNPGVPISRRSSGHPYPRSPNAVPSSTAGLARPNSMDFGTHGYNASSQALPAGGPQRKFSSASIAGQYTSQQQVSSPYTPQQQQTSQFYFHPNQSHPGFTNYDSYTQQQSQQQQLPRYNGSLFQTNGHPATSSQQHVPAYPSNLVPGSSRQLANNMSTPKEDPLYSEFGSTLADFMDDDPEHDYMGTQASTPGNYDFSTNPSMTNLNISLAVPIQQQQQFQAQQIQQQRLQAVGLGLQGPGLTGYTNSGATQYARPQAQHLHELQQQAQRAFYNNSSGAQSTPNLQWTPNHQNQISPARR